MDASDEIELLAIGWGSTGDVYVMCSDELRGRKIAYLHYTYLWPLRTQELQIFNANYGLTTGQASSLTPQGQPMNTSPDGIPEQTLPSMDLIVSLKPSFVARGFSGDIKLMRRILKAAIQHRGFAFVEMLQVCPTYNHFATHEYLLDRYFDANADGHDPGNLEQARALATRVQDRIACGILYQRGDAPDFYSRLIPRQGVETTCVEEVRRYDVSEYWKDLV
jgi:2-oxoglutarate ferredoxin oxidoreductase subunit beta